MRYAVVSSDVNPAYSYFPPVLSILWKALGYRTITLLIGEKEHWESDPGTAFVLKSLPDDEKISFVPKAPGQAIYTTAQVSRLYACALPELQEDDYLLTTDADMIPLCPKYFSQQDPAFDIHVFCANAYNLVTETRLPAKFPMCYLGGNVPMLREVMKIGTKTLAEALLGHLAQFKTHQVGWDHDELHFIRMLYRSKIFNPPAAKHPVGGYSRGRVQLIFRNRHCGHMHRRWRFHEKILDNVDCHFAMHGYRFTKELYKLLDVYFPNQRAEVENYTTGYLKARGMPT